MIVSLGKCSIPVWVSISDGHWQISIHFQKIREIVVCTNEKKSDFHIGHDEEIIYICCDLTSFFLFFLQNFVAGTSKNLSNDSKEQKIAWLTPTGIQFPNGPWVLGMEISSSLGLPTALGRKKFSFLKLGSFGNPIIFWKYIFFILAFMNVCETAFFMKSVKISI